MFEIIVGFCEPTIRDDFLEQLTHHEFYSRCIHLLFFFFPPPSIESNRNKTLKITFLLLSNRVSISNQVDRYISSLYEITRYCEKNQMNTKIQVAVRVKGLKSKWWGEEKRWRLELSSLGRNVQLHTRAGTGGTIYSI